MHQPYRIERHATGQILIRDSATGCLCLPLSPAEAQDLAQRLQARDDAQHWHDANGPAQEAPEPAVWVDPAPWLL